MPTIYGGDSLLVECAYASFLLEHFEGLSKLDFPFFGGVGSVKLLLRYKQRHLTALVEDTSAEKKLQQSA